MARAGRARPEDGHRVGRRRPTATPWSCSPKARSDAFLAFPPEPQELRARKLGRVILSTVTDQPWSQYFCCMLFGNRAWVREHPVATKRLLRAILKAADFCAAEPENAAQRLVDGGFTKRYDYALQTLQEIPYRAWREYDRRGHACASTRCGCTRWA